jgi:hypothetical protein
MTMTVNQGGVNTVDPLERLSVMPTAQEPQLVELGVLHGGKRVLFAVEPGTVLSGPGRCTPGPIDCEILSLGQDQTESVAQQTPNGPAPAVLFAVTRISAVGHGSAAAADRARREASATGRALLNRSTSQALSLFRYDPRLGSVVDLRNLTTVVSSPTAAAASVPPTNATTATTNAGNSAASLQVRMQLLPQSLRGLVRSGIAVRMNSNEPANGIAWVTISRAAAKRLELKTGDGPFVVIGRGTVSSIKGGQATLHFRLSPAVSAKLKRAKHLALTLHLTLVGPAHDHLTIDLAGRY